ncbi:CAP domain-containing protein [Streptomyces sp. NRRL F-2747]|uniref:CAP domain-containing protein n=1 Tax=Streptomyces sp. NRRL F-2747 TaxID=1463843 RepID=UPI00131CB47C|nr:CAP domain-containing protein [Streptomyces sp. NRRL F-2747]
MAIAATLMAGGMVLGAGATASAAVSSGLPSEVSPADQAALLSDTNAIRQTEGASSIAWDAALASGAQSWADNPSSHAGGLAHDDSFNNGAENISGAGPSQAVSQWGGEKAAYDAAGPDWDTNSPGYRNWGHYWNMVQKNYTKMGCGAAAGVTVCRYA